MVEFHSPNILQKGVFAAILSFTIELMSRFQPAPADHALLIGPRGTDKIFWP